MSSIAIVLIGNELLSGKIEERNARFAIPFLRGIGADLERVVTIPDTIAEIAAEVRHCAARYECVITSGGVGPTHDDLTYEGVAAAMGRPLVEDPQVADLLRRHLGERLTEDHLRMARFPEGARVHFDDALPMPLASVENIYILPGIPSFFRASLTYLAPLCEGLPFYLEDVICHRDEGEIATALRMIQESHADVGIGSYPAVDEGGRMMVRITVEGRNAVRVSAAAGRIRQALGQSG